MLLQGIDHFHNGPVHPHLFAAVVDVVVAVHHAMGNSVQFAGVLAELSQNIAYQQQGQEHGDDDRENHKGYAGGA